MSDRELILAAQARDAEAFGQLVTRYQRAAYGHAVALLGHREDARDAMQFEVTRLNSMLGDLTLPDDAPEVSTAVVAGIRRGARTRFVLVAVGVLLVKLMDVLGVFGGGAVPRLIVTAIALLLFALLKVNPFRIVRAEEVQLDLSPEKGGNHGNA